MLKLDIFDLLMGFAGVIDLVNKTLAAHHQRTAMIVDQIARRLDLPPRERQTAMISAMLHDLGVVSLREKADSLLFEQDMLSHSLAGFVMLKSCPLLQDEAVVLRYHHTSRKAVTALPLSERPLAGIGNLIHLADSIDMCSRLHPAKISKMLIKGTGSSFEKKSAEAALDFLAGPDFFDRLADPAPCLSAHSAPPLFLEGEEVIIFSRLFSNLIDSKSPFTATHSAGVAGIGRALHEMAGFPKEDRFAIFAAGLLHDIGKLGVPTDLLEKPGALSGEEFKMVSRHAALSLEVLSRIPGFEKVAPWGGLHHEKLNGRGYPNGLRAADIPPEARLMAVADIMTALTEDRPYRAGLSEEKTMDILKGMAAEGAIDGDMLLLLRDNYAEVNDIRRKAQEAAAGFFKNMAKEVKIQCLAARDEKQDTIHSLITE